MQLLTQNLAKIGSEIELWRFKQFVFTRDSIYAIARICYRSSVRPSVRWVYHRKTVEVRMMTCSPYVAPSL